MACATMALLRMFQIASFVNMRVRRNEVGIQARHYLSALLTFRVRIQKAVFIDLRISKEQCLLLLPKLLKVSNSV